jgi:hypothetical protein
MQVAPGQEEVQVFKRVMLVIIHVMLVNHVLVMPIVIIRVCATVRNAKIRYVAIILLRTVALIAIITTRERVLVRVLTKRARPIPLI